MTRSPKGLAAVALIAALLGSAACIPLPNPGQTPVSRSELYESSEPEYDAFFQRLHSAQLLVVEASNEERTLRQALATELGLEKHASMELVSERLLKKFDELAEHDSKLVVEFIGLDGGISQVDAVVTLTDSAGNTQTTSFTTTLAAVAKRLAKFLVRLRATAKSVENLQLELPALEDQVSERFRLLGPIRAKETRRNLADARTALPSIASAIKIAEQDATAMHDLFVKPKPTEAEPKPAEPTESKKEADGPSKKKPSGKAPKKPAATEFEP